MRAYSGGRRGRKAERNGIIDDRGRSYATRTNWPFGLSFGVSRPRVGHLAPDQQNKQSLWYSRQLRDDLANCRQHLHFYRGWRSWGVPLGCVLVVAVGVWLRWGVLPGWLPRGAEVEALALTMLIAAVLGLAHAFLLRPFAQNRVRFNLKELATLPEVCVVCGYELGGLPVEPDGCLVFPECGGAWLPLSRLDAERRSSDPPTETQP